MLAQKLSIQPCSHVDSRDPDVWWWIKSQCAVNATLLASIGDHQINIADHNIARVW
jgi:hypothetical protein